MKLLIDAIWFGMYVMALLSIGFYIATHWLDNKGTVFVFAIAYFILVMGSGLAIMGKR